MRCFSLIGVGGRTVFSVHFDALAPDFSTIKRSDFGGSERPLRIEAFRKAGHPGPFKTLRDSSECALDAQCLERDLGADVLKCTHAANKNSSRHRLYAPPQRRQALWPIRGRTPHSGTHGGANGPSPISELGRRK